jgi:hypothetical protein
MQRFLFLFLLPLFCSNLLFAQTLDLDSLRKARHYAHIYSADAAGLQLISTSEGYDIFTPTGQKVNPTPYLSIEELNLGYRNVRDSTYKHWLLDRNGKVLFSHDFDKLQVIRENVFYAEQWRKMNEKAPIERCQTLINEKNEPIIPLSYMRQPFFSVYNANMFPVAPIQSVFAQNYEYHPADSFVVLKGMMFLMYDIQGREVAQLPLQAGIEDSLLHLFSDETLMASEKGKFQFVSQQNKIFFIAKSKNGSDTYYLEWEIAKKGEKARFPKIMSLNNPEKKHFYSFGIELREFNGIGRKNIFDENNQLVFEGEFDRYSAYPKLIDDYIIFEQELVGVVDTTFLDKPNIPKNPLYLQSCKDSLKKNKVWMYAYILMRLSDKKEMYRLVRSKPSEYGYAPLAFFGKDKCVVKINHKVGIIDFSGKWLIEPSFSQVEIIDNEYVVLSNKNKSYLYAQDLTFHTFPKYAIFRSLGENMIEVIELKKRDSLNNWVVCREAEAEATACSITILSENKIIYETFLDKNFTVEECYNFLRKPPSHIFEKGDSKGKPIGSVILLADKSLRFFPTTEIEETADFYFIKREKWGIIDKNGKQISEFIYDKIWNLGDYYAVISGETVLFLDKKGKEIYRTQKDLHEKAIKNNVFIREICQKNGYGMPFDGEESEYDIWEHEAYISEQEEEFLEKSLQNLFYLQNGKAKSINNELVSLHKPILYGYIDAKGKEVVPPVYQELLKITPSLLMGRNAHFCEEINLSKGTKKQLPYDKVERFAKTLFAVKDSSFAFMDSSLQLISKFSYKKLSFNLYSEACFVVRNKQNKVGLYSYEQQKILIPVKYKYIQPIYPDYADAKATHWQAQKQGIENIDIYDTLFRPISLNQYSFFSPFNILNEYFAIAEKNGKKGVVNYRNKVIVPFVHSDKMKKYLSNSEDDTFFGLKDENEIFLYTSKGKLIYKGNIRDNIVRNEDYFLITQYAGKEKTALILTEKGELKMAYKGEIESTDSPDNYVIAYFAETNQANLLDRHLKKVLPWGCDSIFLGSRYAWHQTAYVIYKGGKAGIVDSEGKILLNPEKSDYSYIEIYDSERKIKIALAKQGKKEYYIHFDGTLYFPKGYDFYKIQNENCCTVMKNGKAGCIDTAGNVLVPFVWDNVETIKDTRFYRLKNTRLYSARRDCEYYLLDTTGKQLYNFPFESANMIDDANNISLSRNKKYGLVNAKGKELLACEYDKVALLQKAFYAVEKDKKIGVLDSLGKWLIPMEYDKMNYEIGAAMLILSKKDKSTCLNLKNGFVIPPIYKEIRLVTFGTSDPLDNKPTKYYFIVTAENGKMGIFDVEGKTVLPIIYDNIRSTSIVKKWDSQREARIEGFLLEKEGNRSSYLFD